MWEVFIDGGERTRNINQIKKSDLLQAYICPFVTNAVGKIIFSVSKWNIVNQLVKHGFFCG